VIAGSAELAREDLAAGRGERAARSLERVAGAVHDGASVTRLLLDHSGAAPRELENLDVRPLCTRAVARVLERHGSVRISVDFAPLALTLRGDRGQVEEALEQVLAHAASRPADAPVRMRVGRIHNAREARGAASTLAPPGDYIEIAISDRGPALAADARERAFVPFLATREHTRGLGLPAAAGIVRSHGGLLLLDSARERGTTITLWFPVANA
jgi:signal transduction histidine kinase